MVGYCLTEWGELTGEEQMEENQDNCNSTINKYNKNKNKIENTSSNFYKVSLNK